MKEHDQVKLKETYMGIPAGMPGTILHVYPSGNVFEVEFIVGVTSKIITLNRNRLVEDED